MVMTGKTNIQVSRETRDYLAKLGGKDDTYDDIASQYESGSHETSLFINISLLMSIISVLYEMP